MNRKISIALIIFGLAVLVSCQKQQEESRAEAVKLSTEEVKKAISAYIQNKSDAEGKFGIEDAVENRARELTFGYIHDSVHDTGDGRYFACVDFTETPADTLDLDFYVAADSDGKPMVSEVVIHKVNGVARE
ncbi:MAG: hypothetical protein V3U07_06195 [Nitrospirales bacterium]